MFGTLHRRMMWLSCGLGVLALLPLSGVLRAQQPGPRRATASLAPRPIVVPARAVNPIQQFPQLGGYLGTAGQFQGQGVQGLQAVGNFGSFNGFNGPVGGQLGFNGFGNFNGLNNGFGSFGPFQGFGTGFGASAFGFGMNNGFGAAPFQGFNGKGLGFSGEGGY
ncbi:MAG: hypothetical protein J0I06_08275 [Planctomycetes bacterium]|nr:hypothetical protein [Planctomycetota bacterium]